MDVTRQPSSREAASRQFAFHQLRRSAAPVTNRKFIAFVEATGHVTVAEMALRWVGTRSTSLEIMSGQTALSSTALCRFN